MEGGQGDVRVLREDGRIGELLRARGMAGGITALQGGCVAGSDVPVDLAPHFS